MKHFSMLWDHEFTLHSRQYKIAMTLKEKNHEIISMLIFFLASTVPWFEDTFLVCIFGAHEKFKSPSSNTTTGVISLIRSNQ